MEMQAKDTIDGGSEDDFISGGDGKDTVRGGDGDDILLGLDGDDTLHGDAGDDEISGNAGDDKLFGGLGRDTITGGEGEDTISGGDHDDTIDAGVGDDVVGGGAGNDVITAGNGNDEVSGDQGNDQINAGDGDDLVRGGADNDTINAGDGNDEVFGGGGNDLINGGNGEDSLWSNIPGHQDQPYRGSGPNAGFHDMYGTGPHGDGACDLEEGHPDVDCPPPVCETDLLMCEDVFNWIVGVGEHIYPTDLDAAQPVRPETQAVTAWAALRGTAGALPRRDERWHLAEDNWQLYSEVLIGDLDPEHFYWPRESVREQP